MPPLHYPGGITLYPRLRLLRQGGALFWFPAAQQVHMRAALEAGALLIRPLRLGPRTRVFAVEGAGLHFICSDRQALSTVERALRACQRHARAWAARRELRRRRRALALGMAWHPRLGRASPLAAVPPELLPACCA